MNKLLVAILLIATSKLSLAHDKGSESKVTYLGNEALLINSGESKVLFDPFFHSHFNTYTLVPDGIRKKIFNKEKPFDAVDAIFVSHAHGDHFSEADTLRYLQENPEVALIAPQQAIEMMQKLSGFSELKNSIKSIDLAFKQKAKSFELKGMTIEAVRIPHAGWPQRADIQNMVYRVALDKATVMHMGDADVDKSHYQAHQNHWDKQSTDVAFPPYWFFYSDEGNQILEDILGIKKSIGVHVPTVTPKGLNDTGKDFFTIPGESRTIKTHAHDSKPKD